MYTYIFVYRYECARECVYIYVCVYACVSARVRRYENFSISPWNGMESLGRALNHTTTTPPAHSKRNLKSKNDGDPHMEIM